MTNCLLNVEAIAQKQSYGACLDCCPAYFLAGWREQHNLHNEHGVLGRFSVQVSDSAQVTNVCLMIIQDCTGPCSAASRQWQCGANSPLQEDGTTFLNTYSVILFWTDAETNSFMYLSVLLISKVAWMHRNLPSSSKNPGAKSPEVLPTLWQWAVESVP